jgi:tetratricopeptide (TPR) repeat protein
MDEDIQPAVELDTDIAEAPMDVSEPVIDIDEALSGPLEVEPSVAEPPSEQTQQEIDAVASLNPEDEENIKEKMTEAEVFVRYGLVDKAVEQLKDVLDRFRFHTSAREKLIEIYRDQGMSNEAAEELAQLSTIYTRLGQNDNAEKARIEARSINPALEEISAESLVPEDEVDLTPESPEQYDDLALDVEVPAALPNEPDEVAVSMDEDELPFAAEIEEEEQPTVSAPTDEVEVVINDGPDDEFSVEVDMDDVAGEIGSLEEPTSRVEEEPVPPVPPVQPEPVVEEEPLADELPAPPAPVTDELSIPGDEFSVGAESSPASGDVEIDLDGIAGEEPDDDVQVEFDDGPAGIPEASEPSVAADADSPFEEEDRTVPPSQAGQADQAASELSAPAVPPPPEPVPTAPAARDDLAEVDEYMALGLYEDARDTLREILKKRPDDPQVLAKIDEVGFSVTQLQEEAEASAAATGAASSVEESLVSAASTPPPAAEPEAPVSQMASVPDVPATTSEVAEVEEDPFATLEGVAGPDEVESVLSGPAGIEGEYVDLASELSDEVFGTQNAVEETSPTGNPIDAITDPGLDEMFREFKKGVEKQLGTEDYDTRYNLGIAYKEMGLLDEAIAEFQLASKDQSRLLECCSMLGLCFLEKGMPQIAIKWFEKGLTSPGRSEEEQHGLRYDLAIAYESAGEPDRALELYMDIYRVNARFRDVKDRVSGLQAAKN